MEGYNHPRISPHTICHLETSIMPILGLTEQGPTAPAHFSLESIIRPNILALVPYRSARDDYDSGILLDANENALGPCLPAIHDLVEKQHEHADGEDMPRKREEKDAEELKNGEVDAADPLLNMSKEQLASLNRYPSPTHDPLKNLIANLRGVPNENWVFLGVGSDEVIDLLFRVTCVPGKDVVITTPPTYGMYEVTANVNDVGVVKVPLVTEGGKFEVDMPAVRSLTPRSSAC
jgi:histidinol-phosphate aminotransferase